MLVFLQRHSLQTPRVFDFVYGFQRDSASSGYKIAMLNRGESPLKGEEPGLEDLLKKVVAAGKFSCTSDFLKNCRTGRGNALYPDPVSE